RHAHRLLAARHHDVAVAIEDRLVAERDGAQARAAQLVDAPGRGLDRDAGPDRGLAGRILALPGAQDLAQDDLGDLAALDPGPLQRGLDGDPAKIVRRQIGERPIECADWRTRRADDDDVVLHYPAPHVRGWPQRRKSAAGR